MTSIICPKCKSHISEWDVICLKCGHSVTPEERVKLVKEQEELIVREHAEKMSTHEAHLRHQHQHQMQMKLDKLSVGIFHVNLDVMTVFIISVFLLFIAALLMLM
jgi:hypothetical protein